MILHRAGHDFAGRGGIFVDEHDERPLLEKAAVAGVTFMAVLAVTAPGLDDHLAARQKFVGDLHRHFHETARVVAQIQYETLHALQLQGVHAFCKFFPCRARKSIQPNISGLLVEHVVRVHGPERNLVARNQEMERLRVPRTLHRYLDLGAPRPLQRPPDVFRGKANGRRIVHGHDPVPGKHARGFAGSARQGVQHSHRIPVVRAGNDLERNPDSVERGVEILLYALHRLGVDIDRMGVELVQHPVNGAFGQPRRGNLLHVPLIDHEIRIFEFSERLRRRIPKNHGVQLEPENDAHNQNDRAEKV